MPDIPEPPGSRPGLAAALADRYTIERELGRGGMAVVYLARDVKHDRKVALKVIQPDLAESVKAERFLREIQIAARLSHPHILPLYDSGDVAGVLYYVMPYVEGESLRDRLTREKQLAIDDAVRITRDVASALGEAHDQGVVHRDIKPENILLTKSGHAVVADFGIARALTVAGGTVTATGLAVGTPAYMSPEQGSGSGEVDGRSDIYSLGCVLYEMLVGRPPFVGATAQEILARHALDPVPSLKAARSDVREGVERAIAKALAKQPVGRFPTAAQFAGAFAVDTVRASTGRPDRWVGRRLAALAVGAVVMAGGVALGTRAWLHRGAAGAPAERSVAVLPFLNLSADTANEYFTDGMTDELISALSRVEGLRVPARTSSFAFKGKTADIRDIGRQLSVAHVLEGSVQWAGSRLRVTAQLIKVVDGYHVWSATYDRELKDVFAVQDEVTRAIAAALKVKLADRGSGAIVPQPTQSVEAHDLYLRGLYFENRRTKEANDKAIALFEAVVARDSGYALAYDGLADSYVRAANQGWLPRDEAIRRGRAAALRAAALDPNSAETHTALGRVHQSGERDLRAAETEYREAVRLNPQYALAQSWYAQVLNALGRHDDAIDHARIAVQLDPVAPVTNYTLGEALYYARHYDEAIHYLTQARDLEPTFPGPHLILASTYLKKGRHAEAIAEARRNVDLGAPYGLGQLGMALAMAGRRVEARDILLRVSGREDAPLWLSAALVYIGLGEKDSAFAALERWVREGTAAGLPVLRNPLLDPLRRDPRFAQLVKTAGLEP